MSSLVNFFLLDGIVNGRIQVSTKGKSTIAYKIPRADLPKCKSISLLKQGGIYFLVGKDDNNDDKIYVGQAMVRKINDGLFARLSEHAEPFWNYAIAITSTADDLGATDLNYLENAFYNLAVKAGRYILSQNEPAKGLVKPWEESSLNMITDDALLLTGALGCQAFIPMDDNEKTAPELMLSTKNGKYDAKGRLATGGFVVLAGSKINGTITSKCPENVVRAREKYRDRISDAWSLTENTLFPSSSAAAGFVAGYSISGPLNWIDRNGKTLKELEDTED